MAVGVDVGCVCALNQTRVVGKCAAGDGGRIACDAAACVVEGITSGVEVDAAARDFAVGVVKRCAGDLATCGGLDCAL